VAISQLFQDGRALKTLMLWVAFFCCLLMVYALSSWLPKLMNAAGYGLNSSLAFLLVLNFGAIFGAIGGGWLGDRIGLGRVLLAFFATGALSLSLLALKSPLPVLYLLIGVAGACHYRYADPRQCLRLQFYPRISAPLSGLAMGIGRIGAIIGRVWAELCTPRNCRCRRAFWRSRCRGWWAPPPLWVFSGTAGSGLHADGETSGIDCRLIHCYQELSTAPMSGVVLWLTARNRHMEPPWSRLL